MSTTQTFEPLEKSLPPGDLAEVDRLYREGLDMTGPAEERDAHFQAVAELVGDLALYDLLGEKVAHDRQVTEALAEKFKTGRALEAAENMEANGFAENAPTFTELLQDKTRKNSFRYNHLPPHLDPDVWEVKEKSEIDGLRKLDSFLDSFLTAIQREDGSYIFPDDAEQAQSIRENLTFIGEKEYQAAARGLGTLWKNYLDEDPQRKLCVLAGVSNSKKYPGQRKSDEYLKGRILDTFSDEELEKYSGRLVDDLSQIEDESPDDVRIVLLDDWTISGRQLSRVYREIIEDPVYEEFIDSVEVNLIAASDGRLTFGLQDPDDPASKPIKVKAYYKAHHAEQATTENKSHISGLHSTVNFDFGDTIERLVKRFEKLGAPHEIPSLASIVRPYRNEKSKGRQA